MLFLLISVLPLFLLLSKSLSLKPLPEWVSKVGESFFFLAHSVKNFKEIGSRVLRTALEMACKRKCVARAQNNVLESMDTSLLDLPDLALECILGKLPPAGLCKMAGVCKAMKEMCTSEYIWQRHMREKWGRVIGQVARREWEEYLASSKDSPLDCVDQRQSSRRPNRWMRTLSRVWPLSWLKMRIDGASRMRTPLPSDSTMSWYLSLESGKFRFSGQVYNREHGHAGFMLSCYDAELGYDCHTDTFQARYPPHGRRTTVVEEGVQWERVRAPPVDTPAHDLHISDCLHDLRPGNHIEIQWRRNKEFPYGWWYGTVGHLDICDGNEHFCRCHLSDSVVLEFNQYTPGSRWRRSTVSRKDHKEEGNETDGFYGGIRKLYTKDEISTWKQLWPVEVLE